MKKTRAMVKASLKRKKYENKIESICFDAIAKKKEPFVVDVGAWKGNFLGGAYNHNSNVAALAVEPIPENVKLLEALPIKKKDIFEACVAAENGMVKLYIAGKKHNLVDCSIHKESAEKFGSKNTQELTCEAISMRALLHDVPKVDVLLMNCEGAEYDVMLGGTSWLSKVDRLYLHMHTKADKFLSDEYYFKRIKIMARLLEAGFRMECGMKDMDALSHIIQLWRKDG